MQRRNSRLYAFTLVELLVVIGIIAVLVSILLPALNKARHSADLLVCTANLRSIAQLEFLYSNEYHDYIPLGYLGSAAAGSRQFDYVVGYDAVTGATPRGPFGELYKANLIVAPRAFYCPSQAYDPTMVYNGPLNAWFQPVATGTVRVGYGTRPIARWSGGQYIKPSNTNKAYTYALPKKTKFKHGTAILSDIVSAPYYLQTSHWPVVNVAYIDGSVGQFDARQFPAAWQVLPIGFADIYNPIMLNDPFTPDGGIWVQMDMP